MMEFMIRKATGDDAYDYAACHVSSWQSAYKGIVPDEYLDGLSVGKRAERFKQNIAEFTETNYYCAVYDNKIVGIFIFGACRDEDKPNAGEVNAIYSLEEYWGKGCGAAMLNYAVDTLKSDGYNEIAIWVLEDNIRARRFYEKHGFIFDGTKKIINIGKPLTEIRYMLNEKPLI